MAVVFTTRADAPLDTDTTCSGALTTRWASAGRALPARAAAMKAQRKDQRRAYEGGRVQPWRKKRTSVPLVRVRVSGRWSTSVHRRGILPRRWDLLSSQVRQSECAGAGCPKAHWEKVGLLGPRSC